MRPDHPGTRNGQGSLRRAKVAVFAIFGLVGMSSGLFTASLPGLAEQLGLGEARFAGLLFATTVGAIAIMPVAGWLCDRVGSRAVLHATGTLTVAALLIPALTGSYPAALIAVFLFGAGSGMLDIAMNMQAALVERHNRRALMSSFHAIWGIGTVAGGAATAALLHTTGGVRVVLLVTVVTLGILFLLPSHFMLRGSVQSQDRDVGEPYRPQRLKPTLLLILIGLVGAAYISTGAAEDWSGMHTKLVLGGDASSAAMTFTVFSTATTLVRLVGDRLRDRIGDLHVMRLSGLTAVAGFTVVILGAYLGAGMAISLTGWAIVGMGMALVVPVVIGSLGASGVLTGRLLSIVTVSGYVGLLSGPAMIGPLASLTSVTAAFIPAALLAGVVALVGPAVIRSLPRSELPQATDRNPPVSNGV